MITLLYTYIERDIHQRLLKYTLHNFSDDFQYKVSKFRKWEDAQLSLLGRLLLLEGLKKFSRNAKDVDLLNNKHGKPYLKNMALDFNISHSGDLVVCALSTNGNIGVDVELMQDIDIEDFRSQMTISEWNRINSAHNKQSEFFSYWTEKEAALKACGEGLTGVDLKSFEIIENKAMIKNDEYLLQEVNISQNYKCHVAVKSISGLEVNIKIDLVPLKVSIFLPSDSNILS
ncbi:4'-phosphopantetheinyl transferase [Pedobacter suwonensis]|uniref:4'-phosphopantetheinyl transferase n=1 Tax=Pedobacter suwonensis TaxID=332999 RepID=A0A1I0TND3_9SPHI|nr:4'-phosphopantetheinyl transferase [Pedobacter suwonensis]